ncbi:MAG: acyltransferase [Alphaproteobacteria bacterium]|nr:MAG: acyltransferase [Alphaproteobacteria bacterium]
MSARQITLGDNVMLGSNVILSDSDWHEIYDRTSAPGDGAPITLGDNVWIGERSTVLKGVSIGENSIIGAGSVVTHDIPANVVAAGCPARVVKALDPAQGMITRAKMFEDPARLEQETQDIYKYLMRDNTLMKWLRVKLAPTQKD